MMTSIVIPPCPPTCTIGKTTSTTTTSPNLRRYSYQSQAPPLPPRPAARRNSTVLPTLQLKAVTSAVAMTSRYTRPVSPRGRYSNPARSSTGTFDPYYDSNYYGRPSSPRSSVDRVAGYSAHTYTPSNSISSRNTNLKYDSYSGRPRRNTLTETDDRGGIWPNVGLASTTALPLRTHTSHGHHDRPSSPLTRTWDNRDTYITQGSAPHRREHKRIYSVDDNTHMTKLVAEKDIIESRRDYSLSSGGRTYPQQHKPSRSSEVGDDGFSYTDPASMYRDTEPAWRRPRSGSIERSSRPTSMIIDRAPRTSTRELGPPPSTRGFDKINSSISKSGSRHRGRSPSVERSRDIPKYDAYPELQPRPASTSYHAPAIHQAPIHQAPIHQAPIHQTPILQDPRRDAYRPDYGRSDRDVENRRYAPVEQLDPDVSTRGFGIASPIVAPTHDPTYDRQPPYQVPEPPRTRPVEQYYSAERAEARMPEPRIPRERDIVPTYDERPRDRDHGRREKDHVAPSSALPTVAGAAAGAAATLGAAGLLKSRNKEREERERERELEKEREQRREWDERDRRDRIVEDRRDDKRDRAPEDRRERGIEDRRERDRTPEDRIIPPPAAAAAYASSKEADRKPRERPYEDDDRDRRPRKAPSSEGSGDERPRHYVDPSVARESERRKDMARKEAPLDPDEEYRRRIQQEAERSGRTQQDRGDSDRDKERQRRREERERSRDRSDDTRSRGAPSTVAEPPQSRYDDRSSQVLDSGIVQEPESMPKEQQQQPARTVQIVTPPKEPAPQPKGILRKPTEKFPEEPEPIREGVAPHKSQMKGKDIPINARWTKIDRKLVNPEALEEAKERFEERLDCVIVLRVLTKSEIQKLADRTRAIRESREEEYDRHERDLRDREDDRDRRSRRSQRDDDDRDRRRDYDDSDMDNLDRERDRDRSRDRPRMIESARSTCCL